MDYWKEKVAIVTGGSSGLGKAIALSLAQKGAQVVIAARNADKLATIASNSTNHSANITAVPTDVTQQDQVDALLATTIDKFGRLDVFVNCVGRSSRGEAISTTPEEFQELWELNFLSLVRCSQAAMPHLMATKGHLVNIGSLASKISSRYLGAYPASKFPVAAYSQQLRLELGPQGVHVLLVCPGPIARDDAGSRYDDQTDGLPASAHKPGAGVKIREIQPDYLAEKILQACQHRRRELVIPAKSRLLFALSQLWPAGGDWIIKKMT